jgi:carbamoyltransferase
MSKPIYVLGTGLSHDGSSCLLKDGEIIVAIEKERLSRIKHDGGNDADTVQYCLDTAGIKVSDLSLVVQSANFEKDEIKKDNYRGKRLFEVSSEIPFVSISHHLAHAWSAVGRSPFNECNIMVIDGCGSFHAQCDDLTDAFIPNDIGSQSGIYEEKDSFYFFNGKNLLPIFKDFSVIGGMQQAGVARLPITAHSIGGLYAMAANYCFGSYDDAGKLMGLAPYGRKNMYTDPLVTLQDGRIWVNEQSIQKHFVSPADEVVRPFKQHFQYYADIARWVQEEAEKAILYIFENRLSIHPHAHLCYAGGVALNAVANTKILQETNNHQLYIEPAAGDNGLALGCAYYGWIHILQKEKIPASGNTLLGKIYQKNEIDIAIQHMTSSPSGKFIHCEEKENYIEETARLLAAGKCVAWFQLGSEFGPRALGRRSILADPRIPNIQDTINHDIKLREDFRPFAPAVLYEDKDLYFDLGLESQYMILIDRIKDQLKGIMPGIVHVDDTCRVQTVKESDEPFYQLLKVWKAKSGISVLLNTSFNKKGMPIVETPEDAIDFFMNSKLDVLVLHNYIISKSSLC